MTRLMWEPAAWAYTCPSCRVLPGQACSPWGNLRRASWVCHDSREALVPADPTGDALLDYLAAVMP